MKYNHAFDIAFAVDGSKYEDWGECMKKEKHLVIAALLRRVADMIDGDEYHEAISGIDTYETDE